MLARNREPLPPFVASSAIYSRAFRSFRPPSRVSVSEAAARHRRLKTPGGYSGAWRNEKTPYLVEPMDRMTSRAIDVLVLVGPSQFGKSELILNFIGHAAKYRAGDCLVMQPTKDLAQDFAERRLDQRCLAVSPDLRAELAPGRGADRIFSKVFRNGTRVDAIWPVASQLASRPVQTVIIDERDRIANDIDGEGDPRQLAQNRVKTFGANGLVAEVSSPTEIGDSAILADYAEGDECLWFWPCAECGEYWSPGFDFDRKPTLAHLHFDATLDPDAAGEAARLVCPHCGAADLGEREKSDMNARATWLAGGLAIDRDGRISGRAKATRTASYWFCGLANPFEPLRKLVTQLVAADRELERSGDEDKRRTVYNTVLGFPYRDKEAGAAPLELSEVDRRRIGTSFRLRLVPAGVRFLVAAVDIGLAGFDVGVWGFDEQWQSWLVDRFTLRQLADGKTDLRPAEHPEHWDEITARVLWARYALADRPGHYLPIARVAVDTGGLDGVTENAKQFWIRARRAGIAKGAIMLVKGASEPKAPFVRAPSFETEQQGKARKRNVPIHIVGVTRMKDVIANRLRRTVPGPGFIHLPADLEQRYVRELVEGEVKIDGVWTRKGRNETLDLAVYAAIVAYDLKPFAIDWTNPPGWAIAMPAADAPRALAPEMPPAAQADREAAQAGAASPAALAAPLAIPAAPAPLLVKPAVTLAPAAPQRKPQGFIPFRPDFLRPRR